MPHSLYQFQQLFGAYTRQPRRVKSSAGNVWIIIDTVSGAYEFATLTELRYCVAIGNIPDDYKLPF